MSWHTGPVRKEWNGGVERSISLTSLPSWATYLLRLDGWLLPSWGRTVPQFWVHSANLRCASLQLKFMILGAGCTLTTFAMLLWMCWRWYCLWHSLSQKRELSLTSPAVQVAIKRSWKTVAGSLHHQQRACTNLLQHILVYHQATQLTQYTRKIIWACVI